MSDIEWFYGEGSDRKGPHTAADLKALLADGALTLSSLVWRKGMDGMGPISDIAELQKSMAAGDRPEGAVEEFEYSTPEAGAWSRFWARNIDIAFWAIPIYLFLTPFLIPLYPQSEFLQGMVNTALIVPLGLLLEVPLMALTGSTLGKWLLGIKVRRLDGGKISARGLLRRNFLIWIYGFGLTIPVVGLVRGVLSFGRANSGKRCPWDEQPLYVVRQKPIGWVRRIFAVLALGLMVFAGDVATAIWQPSLWTNPITGRQATLPAGWSLEVIEADSGGQEFEFASDKAAVYLQRDVMDSELAFYADRMEDREEWGDLRDRKEVTRNGVPAIILLFRKTNDGIRYDVEIKVWQVGKRDFWRLTQIKPVKDAPARKEAEAVAAALEGTAPPGR
ncbi:RDD family protein [Lacibacterium aquatile]|uniref:RDD family protein n=1 Tax=Lacibacterium aquatile TaxID=1168082 RepID=A0ABW5DP07_9PROT